MAREKKPPEKTGDCPVWFMTYSDVITLLMTFFILLMTFSTNEPERFEKMQVSMFGGAGATGLAGAAESVERDAVLMRQRPRSARTSMRGSETPEVKEDPGMNAMSDGLAGLDGPQQFDPHQSYSVDMPMSEMFDSTGNLTSEARGHLYTAGQRIRRSNLRAAIRATPDQLDRCLIVAQFLTQSAGLHPSAVGVGAISGPVDASKLQLELRQMGKER